MTPSRSPTSRKCCALMLSATLALQPLVVYAAPITNSPLAERPVQGVSLVKPNIMLTIDDSGSMLWDFVPDFAAFAGPGISNCRDSTVAQLVLGNGSVLDVARVDGGGRHGERASAEQQRRSDGDRSRLGVEPQQRDE